MSAGLTTLKAAGTATETITRPGGHSITVPITVTAPAAPGAPTASNATSASSNALTFPVTLNPSGALPTALAWRYSTDNATWTNGTDIALTSPTLGQALSQSVGLPSTGTLYYVQFAEKNGSGTSSYCTSVTGTTTAGGALSGVQYAGDDFTSYANTAAFLAQVSSTIGGTGDYHTCKYNDGMAGTCNSNTLAIDTSVQYNGHQTLKLIFTPTYGHPQFYSSFSQWGATTTMSDFWFRLKLRYSAGFTTAGTNSGASGAYKQCGWAFSGGNGSGRIELTGSYTTNNPNYEIYDSCAHFDDSAWLPTTSPDVYCGAITDEWTATTPWIDTIIHHRTNDDGKGTTIKYWRAHDGSTPVLKGTAVTATSGGQTAPSVYSIMLAMNYNQPIGTTMSINYGYWEVVDGTVHSNPFGLADG